MSIKRRIIEVIVDPKKAKEGARQATDAIKRFSAVGKSELNKFSKTSATAANQLSNHMRRGTNNSIRSLRTMTPAILAVSKAFLSLSIVSAKVLNGIVKSVSGAINAITRFTSGIVNSFGTISRVALPLGIAGVFDKIIESGLKMTKFESTMSVVTGSVQQSRKELSFLMDTANQMGIVFSNAASPFAKFAAAAKGIIPEQDVKKIFTAFSEVSSALFLTNQEVQGVFLALQQMASKGTISMEELRLQLAERIPGAMRMAARAMEMDVKSLEDAIRAGAVSAEEFLVKFAEQIHLNFASAAEIAATSAFASFNRLKNQLFDTAVEIANAGLLDALADGATRLSAFLKDNEKEIREIGRQLASIVSDVVTKITELKPEDVKSFFVTFATNMGVLREVMADLFRLLTSITDMMDRVGESKIMGFLSGAGKMYRDTLGAFFETTFASPKQSNGGQMRNGAIAPGEPGNTVPSVLTGQESRDKANDLRKNLAGIPEPLTVSEFRDYSNQVIDSASVNLKKTELELLKQTRAQLEAQMSIQKERFEKFSQEPKTFDEASSAVSKYIAAMRSLKDVNEDITEIEKKRNDAILKSLEVQDKFIESVQQGQLSQVEQIEQTITKLGELYSVGAFDRNGGSKEYYRLVNELLNDIDEINEKSNDAQKSISDFAKAAAQNMQTAFADFLFNPFEDGLKGMLKGFSDILRRMAAEIAAQYLLMQFFGALAGSENKFISGVGNAFAGTKGTSAPSTGLSGGNAAGGAVFGGRSYLVGENGPEVLTMGGGGKVSPINSGSGDVSVNIINQTGTEADADAQVTQVGGKTVVDVILSSVATDIARRGVVSKAIKSRSNLARR